MIDNILDFIIRLAWVLLAVATVAYFLRTSQQHGLRVALLRLFSSRLLLPLLVIVVLTVISASLVFIEPHQVGVVVSVVSVDGFRDRPFRSGLHWIVPLAERVITYPISWQTYTMSGKALEGQQIGDDSIVARTKDGQEVSLDCSIIFRINPEQAIWVHIDWQDRYIQDLVRPTVRGAVRTKVADFTVDEVNSDKRADLEAFLDRRLREILEDKGFILDQFVLRNISFSPEYAASVEQKQVAEQRRTQREYEAEQIRKLADGQADQIRKLADGEADKVLTLAEAEARAIEIRAQAEANARVIRAQAEAEALQLVTTVLAENPALLTYQYIDKLAPGINVMLVPSDVPYILPLPTPAAAGPTSGAPLLPAPIVTETLTPTTTVTGTLPVTPTIAP
jgi:regulator of protease activity HflC (stomatin/prohibitin superfamily)